MNPPPPPPPPPPHGDNSRSSGLPPGKYDIFIIPPHSSGSGFLYLPSLQPNINSFVAGFASALALCLLWMSVQPAVQAWWYSLKTSGGAGIILLMVAIGLGAWALGRQQIDGIPSPGSGGTSPGAGPPPQAHTYTNGYANGPSPGAGPPPHQPPPQNGYANARPSAGPAGGERPRPTWQRTNPAAGPHTSASASAGAGTSAGATAGASASTSSTTNGAAKGAWERAREETKRKEEERKAKEAEQKRKEELEKRLKELREKEAREREARERRQKEAEQEKTPPAKRTGSTYSYSAVGEKTNPWPNGPPPAARSHLISPTKRPPAPTAKTYRGTDDEAYSYRPYDTPKKRAEKTAPSSIYSESSYAPSQSTSRTTPPPSQRGTYTTKDPDKIVIKAVYSFNNTSPRTPTSQLVSGVGSVTDGLILRITTEGLFIDDDMRGVPQREWDVKAWTLSLLEVWCPSFRPDASASARVVSSPSDPNASRKQWRRLWGLEKDKPATSAETDALLTKMLQLCRENCFAAASSSTSDLQSHGCTSSVYGCSVSSATSTSSSSKNSNNETKKQTNATAQTGENKACSLHLLRASIRDAGGKRYVFVVAAGEGWKIALGLQRLRKGSQVRALGVSGMTGGDCRGVLESLGWL